MAALTRFSRDSQNRPYLLCNQCRNRVLVVEYREHRAANCKTHIKDRGAA